MSVLVVSKMGSRGVMSGLDGRGNDVGMLSIDEGQPGLRNAGMDMLRIRDSNVSSPAGVLRDMYLRWAREFGMLAS